MQSMSWSDSWSGSLCGLPLVSTGASGFVYAVSDEAVVKAPRPSTQTALDPQAALDKERVIYERLGPHPHITRVLSTQNNLLVLERHQYPLRRRLWELRDAGQMPLLEDVIRWALQVAQALQHVHAHNVRQVDIGPHNILLDRNENAQLADFAGSSIDGCEPLVYASEHAEHPDIPVATLQSEVFALGSTLYEIETTRQPYYDRSTKEIKQLFCAKSFPDTHSLLLEVVIRKCWNVEYQSVSEAVDDLKKI